MSVLSLGDLRAPLVVLRLFGADLAHLPAPCVSVSTIFPDRLELSFHDDGLAGFEAWREALGMAPEAVSYHEQSAGSTRVLRAESDYAGARVELVGYAKIPAAAPACSRDGGVP
ncbi:hypothetical protein GO001_14365 [Streptomyces sp. NRRL B-1677]|uniref:hypothetical protein n=1 Tax=Streptomyces TaxID=1883 RepID=UPI001892B57C|nr:hypothetical protein [Streptomyces sp. NRRL B-1677]MBF6046395.1 hypothetical protein [Streptomyces sp. NRRL B-1677]